MAERKGRRSSNKTAVSCEMTWSAWAQKYAAKASGKLYWLFHVDKCIRSVTMLLNSVPVRLLDLNLQINVFTVYIWCIVMSVTFRYDEPEVENVTQGCSPSPTFSTEVHRIWMSHEWPSWNVQLYRRYSWIFKQCSVISEISNRKFLLQIHSQNNQTYRTL